MSKYVLFLLVPLFIGLPAKAQITGMKKGKCVVVSGTIVRKVNDYTFTVQLANSTQEEDLMISIAKQPNDIVGTPITSPFETAGDAPITYQNANGFQQKRLIPLYKFSNKCKAEIDRKERESAKK